MNLNVLQQNLAGGLATVRPAVASRANLPVLGNVLLSAEDGHLRLAATDLEIGIECRIAATIQSEGQTTVPARLLSDFVGSLPSLPLEATLEPRTQTLSLSAGRYRANIKGLASDEFPHIPTAESLRGRRISIQPSILERLIAEVEFAAANESSRPILTGVLMRVRNRQLTLAAADGFRLAVTSAAVDSEAAVELIVPRRALTEAARLIAGQSSAIEWVIPSEPSRSLFLFQTATLVSQCIEGTFPDYTQIIPKEHSLRVIVDRLEWLRALRVASLFARDSADMCRLHIGDSSLQVSARSDEAGDNVAELEAEVEGGPLEIAFKILYLQDAAKAMSTERLVLEFQAASNPLVIRPAGDEHHLVVIMPMHLGR
jgi:DNA polymerase III subunit beta